MIGDFTYNTPTKLIFGKGVIKNLPDVIAGFGKNVLLTYGGGSIKKMGLYDEVKRLLKGFNIVELSGIEPNPKYNPSAQNHASFRKIKNQTRAKPCEFSQNQKSNAQNRASFRKIKNAPPR